MYLMYRVLHKKSLFYIAFNEYACRRGVVKGYLEKGGGGRIRGTNLSIKKMLEK